MRAGISDLAANHLLSGLPELERELVLPLCEVVSLRLGDVSCEEGEPIHNLDFPVDAAISILDVSHAHIVEITVIGNEGCSGSYVVVGEYSRVMCMVETEGTAIRAPVPPVVGLLPRTPYLRSAMQLHYSLVARHAEIAIACRGSHSPAQRLAKWLKLFSDRTGLQSFPFTSALVATKIGMSNHEATDALEDFQRHGIVNKGLDHLIITNPQALARSVCECFSTTARATQDYLEGLSKLARAHNS